MLLIIDMLHIYYRCWYGQSAYDPIIASNGRNVAHIKATVTECMKIINDFAFHYDETDAGVCVCLDRDTRKKVLYPEYKANRTSKLDADNYSEIEYIANVLRKRGVTVYAKLGFEADDLVYSLVQDITDTGIAVYTNDADLLMHVSEKVDVWIRRTLDRTREYVRVKASRFTQQMSFIGKRELSLYNDTVLYKSSVGDASDNIKGIRGFGEKAYQKKIAALLEQDPDITVPCDRDGVLDFAEKYMGFKEEQQMQFERSLGMVFPLYCEGLPPPETVTLKSISRC